MGLLEETRDLERRTFFAGERLTDVDLNDQEAFHRELRWLHNRSLHQPGIGNGYAVAGAKGDRAVTIGPGYALDAYGREIVLLQTITESIPPVAGEPGGLPAFYYLAVSYPDDSQLPTAETRQGLCGTLGAVRLSEQPLLCWIRLAVDTTTGAYLVPRDAGLRRQVNSGMLIVLAVVEIFQCRLNADISANSLAPRRQARPPSLPYTRSATVGPGQADQPAAGQVNWIVEAIPGVAPPTAWGGGALMLAPLRLRATVKVTSVAVFGAIPRYLVRISGERVLQADYRHAATSTSPVVYAEPQVEVLLDPTLTDHTKFTVVASLLVYVKDAPTFAAAQDTFFSVGNAPNVAQARDALTNALNGAWGIVWVGIEG